MLKTIKKWWFTLIYEEYDLTVWFHSETMIQEDGVKTIKRVPKHYKLKAISKKTPTHIVGKDMQNKFFEIRTVEPFDYRIIKVY